MKKELPPLPNGMCYEHSNTHDPIPGVLWGSINGGVGSQYAMDVRRTSLNDSYSIYMARNGHGTWDSITHGFATYEDAWNAGYARLLIGAWE